MNLLYQYNEHYTHISLWIVQEFTVFCAGKEGLRSGLTEQWVTGGLSGNCRKVPPGAKGDFPRRRAVGERHLPSPSSNSFFAWLLILTSLIGAVCFVEWVTPPGWNGMCSSANMLGTRFFGGLKAAWEWCVRQKYTDGHNLLYPSDLFFF